MRLFRTLLVFFSYFSVCFPLKEDFDFDFNPGIIVFCYSRPDNLTLTLESLERVTNIEKYSVYISQDGDESKTKQVAKRFAKKNALWRSWTRSRPISGSAAESLTSHYKFGIDKVFEQGHSHIIIVEDDMILAPDFLLYFEQTAKLLEVDPTIWCISSWNDIGIDKFNWDPLKLFRNSFFPGLGWMIKAKMWDLIRPHWPNVYWDDFLRENRKQGKILKDLDCIVPQVSRNFNFGSSGTNVSAKFYKTMLLPMKMASYADTDFGDLSYLTRVNYSSHVKDLVDKCHFIENLSELESVHGQVACMQVKDMSKIGPQLGIWNWKESRNVFGDVTIVPLKDPKIMNLLIIMNDVN